MTEPTIRPDEEEADEKDRAMVCDCGCPIFYTYESGARECVVFEIKEYPGEYQGWLH